MKSPNVSKDLKSHNLLSKAEYWSQRYREGRNGWDNRCCHPFLPYVASYLGNIQGKSILIAGAGPGHDAVFFADRDAEVTALDFADEAKKHFAQYYPDGRKVIYLTADFFDSHSLPKKYDVVFEHTLLCAIDPSRYNDYFDAVTNALKPEGIFAGIIWNRSPVGNDGPPFSVANSTVTEALKKRGFKIHVEAPVEGTIPGRDGTESFILAKKSSLI